MNASALRRNASILPGRRTRRPAAFNAPGEIVGWYNKGGTNHGFIARPALSVAFDATRVRPGGSFNATFSDDNLTSATYFDLRFRVPGAGSDEEVWNWQQGPSASHIVAQGATLGDWAVTGVRAHQDPNDHSGPFTSVQATLSVLFSPF